MMPPSPFVRDIFSRWYSPDDPLLPTVLTHSGCVAELALEIADDKDLDVDRQFVCDAAMLHDIGVIACDAPAIHCHGSLPYICHGVEGRRLLEMAGLPRHALVCERHTGSGLTVQDIVRQNLPLPHRDMCPVSLEEKLICYADKFFSKSGRLSERKPLEKVIRQMETFGEDSLRRFLDLHALFS